MARDWRKMAWLSWKSYYRNRYGKEYKGEVCLTVDELKLEWFILTIEGMERKKIRSWNGQETVDEIYNGKIKE